MDVELDLAYTILTHVDAPVVAVNSAGLVLFANPAAERVLGWPYSELAGTDLHCQIHDCCGSARCSLRDALTAGRRVRSQDLFRCKDGQRIQLCYSTAPIAHHNQQLGCVVQFCPAAEDGSAQRARDEYLDLLAHDIQTPLTSLLGYTNLLERRLLEHSLEREVGYAQMINHTAKHVSKLLQTMHSFSTHDRATDEHDLVQLTLGCIRHLPESEQRRITLDAPQVLPARCSQVSIERVLLNLLTNALKYSQPSTPIRVTLSAADGSAVIAVADRGPGIAPADLPRIFEKFYRARGAKAMNGSGLGLYISRLIVESHGGRIWAESIPDQGSTFCFSLPLDG